MPLVPVDKPKSSTVFPVWLGHVATSLAIGAAVGLAVMPGVPTPVRLGGALAAFIVAGGSIWGSHRFHGMMERRFEAIRNRSDILSCATGDGVWSFRECAPGCITYSRKFLAIAKEFGTGDWPSPNGTAALADVFCEEDRQVVLFSMDNLTQRNVPFSVEVRMARGGARTWFRLGGRSFVDGQGRKVFCGNLASIHAYKSVEEEVNDIAMFTIENPYPVFRMTSDGVVMIANEAANPLMSVWGIGIGEPIPASITQLVMTSFSGGNGRGQRAEMEFTCGQQIFAMNFVNHPTKGYVNVYCMDVTERERANRELDENRRKLSALNQSLKQQEERMRHMAQHDSLTALPNRALFYDRLAMTMEYSRRHGKIIAVMMLDLDRFKQVNDTLGHAIGDELLITVARRMSDSVRASDTVARIGGDEFMILLNDIRDEDGAITVAEKVLTNMRPPVRTSVGVDLAATPSIGVAFCRPDDNISMDILCKMADVAMYHAKRDGKNTFRVFNGAMPMEETGTPA